jgi:BolA family transcriptional regulator, general stress-responsive regulator
VDGSDSGRIISYCASIFRLGLAINGASLKSRRERIETLLVQAFKPEYIHILDESRFHQGHHSFPEGGSETHFRVLIVSASFSEISRLERQRQVNAVLKDEFSQGLHALALKIYSPEEFTARGRPTDFE